MIRQNTLEKSHIVLYIYWLALLIWQNVRSVGNRGAVDTMIKAGLIMLLVFYFCLNVQRLKINALLASLLLLACAGVTLMSSGAITFSLLLYYLYPVFLYFIIYAVGWNAQINKKQFISFLNWVIFTVAYIVIYAIIFCRDQFESAFSISSAYGNELSSFLISSHEYGMYLSYGIMAIFVYMELSESVSFLKKILYTICAVAFFVNLILTFSRTAIVSFIAMFAVYTIFCAKKSIKRMLLLIILGIILAIIFVPQLNNFIITIVFKDGANSGRDELAQTGLMLFKKATSFQKFFGNADFNATIEQLTSHSNLHNGYIQMLVTNGIKGVVFLVAVMLTAFRGNISIKNCSASEKNLCRIFNAFLVASGLFMLTNTSTLFYSYLDSYFLTLFAIIVPKYVRNAIESGDFDSKD